jgi:uncharacterized protein
MEGMIMGNSVVHFEVIGDDGPKLQKFYSDLFGWHIQNMPDMKNYGVVDTHAGGGINGGVGEGMEAGDRYVIFYIEVPDPQKALDKIEKAGGKTLHPVMEIPNIVTFAQFADPSGNRVGLVKEGEGPSPSSGNNPAVSWFEVLGTDAEELARFYKEQFGWDGERGEMGNGAVYVQVQMDAKRGIAGGIGNSPMGTPQTTVYAEVKDLQKCLDKAESLGAKTMMPPMSVSEGTNIALFVDPEGNTFGIYNRTA